MHFFSREFSNQSERRASQSSERCFHHLANFRLARVASRGKIDFPVDSQCSWCDDLVADQLVRALVGHFYRPVRSNAQRALYCPSSSRRIDLLDGNDVPEEAGQIFKITIKLENLLDRALDGYSCFDRIFV